MFANSERGGPLGERRLHRTGHNDSVDPSRHGPVAYTGALRPKAGGKPTYICGTDLGGCGKIRVLAADFEHDVLERLFNASGTG
jgi:hypothetical protein